MSSPPVTVSTTGELVAAIANANTAGGLTTITLAQNTTFDFTGAIDPTNGANALPAITSDIIIVGNGDTIERDSKSTTTFRLFDVTSDGSLILENLTLQGGQVQGAGASAEGGAIYNSGTLALSGVTVEGNEATGLPGANGTNQVGSNGGDAFGGGLYVAGGSVSLTKATNFNHNFVHAGNGGFGGNSGSAQHGYLAGLHGGDGGKGMGGGIYVATGTVGLNTNTIVEDNYAFGGNGGSGGNGSNDRNGGAGGNGGDGRGGGLYVAGGSVILNNVEITLNEAKGGFGGNGGNGVTGEIGGGNGGNGGNGTGGGLNLLGGTSVTLANTLIAQNRVVGGIAGSPGTSGTLKSVIPRSAAPSAGQASGPDVFGIVSSSDHDLIGNTSGSDFNTADGDILNPSFIGLAPLANNGGATAGAPGSQQVVPTMALLPSSPAIDHGSNALAVDASGNPLTTDQRGPGFARVVNGTIDIGAFEVQPPPSPSHSPSPSPSPTPPPTLHTPSLLGFFDGLLGGIKEVHDDGTVTVIDRIFGITLFVSSYDSGGNLTGVTLFGFNVTFLFRSL